MRQDQKLELQLQQNTQRDIATIKHDIGKLIEAYAIIDGNMRQAYSLMVAEQNKLTVRINFLIEQATQNFIKNGGSKEEFEKLFKEFEIDQTEKMQAQIAEIIKKQQEEIDKKQGENNANGNITLQ